MNLRMLATAVAVTISAAFGTGCVVTDSNAFDDCVSDRDCHGFGSDYCRAVTQNWGNGDIPSLYACTTSCYNDSDCGDSHNGSFGFCSRVDMLGLSAGTCFERCSFDTDCGGGFICAGPKDVYGLPSGEAVCVPAPTGPVIYSYSTCSAMGNDGDCAGSSTPYCSDIEPKWINDPSTNWTSVCSQGCVEDRDCAQSANGDTGFCAPANSLNAAALCVERCSTNSDCANGLVCTQMRDIAGLPNITDGICLPPR